MSNERFALCGGTYDPIHRGHVDPVMSVYEKAGWSRVFFIPAFTQPFKAGRRLTSGYHRFAMTVLAIEDDSRMEANPIELERADISYTVDTIEAFRETWPDAVLDWVIGDDNLAELPKWRSLSRIFELANFAVLKRSGSENLTPELQARVRKLEEKPRNGAVVFLPNQVVPISATDLRSRLSAGGEVSGLVHPRVEQYIRRHRLYRATVPIQTR